MKFKNNMRFVIFSLAIVGGLTLFALSTGKAKPPLTTMMEQEEIAPLPTLTSGTTTSEIEQDLNNITITSEDDGFAEIESDLKSL